MVVIDRPFWQGRRVLVTGHTGFKGSWLTAWLSMLGAEVTGLALAPARPGLFVDAGLARDCRSHCVDIADADAVRDVVAKAEPEVVFHLAAQSLVRTSYAEGPGTWATNVMGTIHLLDALRAVRVLRAVVVVTSDKCYEQCGVAGHRFVEGDPLGGHDPYSSSKAAAEIAVASWRCSYFDAAGVGIATARAGNVVGGGDWAEDRLLPDLARSAIDGTTVMLRSPQATRPWQHVLDALAGYLMLAQRLHRSPSDFAGAWNFGPDAGTMTVAEVAACFADRLDAGVRWRAEPSSTLHEASSLALDSTKAGQRLDWQTTLSSAEAIRLAADAYRVAIDGGDQRETVVEQLARFGSSTVDLGEPA